MAYWLQTELAAGLHMARVMNLGADLELEVSVRFMGHYGGGGVSP